jgi:hypothetical protein
MVSRKYNVCLVKLSQIKPHLTSEIYLNLWAMRSE